MNKKTSLVIVIMILLLASFRQTQAHTVEPVEASPAAGSILDQSPAQVKLVFEEEISEDGSTLQVFDDKGQQVDNGDGGVDLNDPGHVTLIASLPALPVGVYQVKWTVTLLDGDASEGGYYFGVGDVTLPQAAVETPAETSNQENLPASTTPLAGWLVLGGVILIAGGVGYYLARRSSQKSSK